MTLRWLVATLHLLALPLGLGAVFVRGRALRGTLDAWCLKRVFRADTLWGVAAALWIGTGLVVLMVFAATALARGIHL